MNFVLKILKFFEIKRITTMKKKLFPLIICNIVASISLKETKYNKVNHPVSKMCWLIQQSTPDTYLNNNLSQKDQFFSHYLQHIRKLSRKNWSAMQSSIY